MKDITIDLSHLLGFKLTDTVRAAQTDAKMGGKPVDPRISAKIGIKQGLKPATSLRGVVLGAKIGTKLGIKPSGDAAK